jgi:hypothetical protein
MSADSQISESDPSGKHGVKEAFRLVVLEIEQIEQAQRELDARLEKAMSVRDLLRQLISSEGTAPEDDAQLSNAVGNKRKKPTRHQKGSLTGEIVRRSKTILISAGRPLERSELLEAIEKDGFKMSASNPAKFIGRALWENEDFIHIPKAGYWIKDRPLPKKSTRS